MRLDRFIFLNDWDFNFPHYLQEFLPRSIFGHCPIVLDSNPSKWGTSPFRFENMWLSHIDFKEKVKDWWGVIWSKEIFGDIKEKKDVILKDIALVDSCEGEGALTDELATLSSSKIIKLEELLLREKVHWRQRAQAKWIKEEDYNSKYFQKEATGGRKKKFIKSLESMERLRL